VTRDSAAGHLIGPVGSWRDVGELAAAIGSTGPRPTRLVCLTQRRQQFAPQSATGQDIQGGIDRFGRELLAHVRRIRASQPSGNLFRRTAVFEVSLDILPQPGIKEFTGASGLASPVDRLGLSGAGSIQMALCRVAGVFPTQGAGRTVQDAGEGTERVALGEPRLRVARSSARK
jgi:hypothetical protein